MVYDGQSDLGLVQTPAFYIQVLLKLEGTIRLQKKKKENIAQKTTQ